jgi:hypothetical protein
MVSSFDVQARVPCSLTDDLFSEPTLARKATTSLQASSRKTKKP